MMRLRSSVGDSFNVNNSSSNKVQTLEGDKFPGNDNHEYNDAISNADN
jgi:hypothetical protein